MFVLQELRDQVESDETNEEVVEPEVVETPEAVESETEQEAPEADDQDEDEEVDEIDLSLDDEVKPVKRTPEQALVYKLTKAKKKAKTAEERLAELEAENEQLRKGQAAPAPTAAPQQANQASLASQYGYPPVPVMYTNGINTEGEYQEAYAKWSTECRRIDAAKQANDQAIAAKSEATQTRAVRLAERASSFIKDNKIKQDSATDRIQAGITRLDEALGVDGIALELLDNIGDGSEKLAYFLGSNDEALSTVSKLFQEDKRGFKVSMWLANTANKLNRKNTKHISNAPAPDEALEGNGSSSSAAKLQAEYDKETDFDKLRKIREKAKGLGITLS